MCEQYLNMKKVLQGVVHKVPNDLRNVIISSDKIFDAWNNLTPLARNEWVCWITSVKRADTRADHIKRAREEIFAGKKRPCCWPGCPHREK